MKKIFLCIYWMFLSGCALVPSERQELVRSIRILAVRANKPIAKPGDAIELSALVSSLYIQPVQMQWWLCKNSSDVNAGCVGKEKASNIGEKEKVTFTIPVDTFPKDASLLTQFRGKYLPVTLVAQAGVQREVAVKRIVASPLDRNKNPSIAKVELFENKKILKEPHQISMGATVKFVVTLQGGARETYVSVDASGKVHKVKEKLAFSWYVSDGRLQGGRITSDDKPENQWKAPEKPSTLTNGVSTVYVIVRDGRGGVDWKIMTLLVK